MELWEPRASVKLRPGAREAILSASQASPTTAAAMSRLLLPTEQGTVCITQPTGGSLADRELRLTADQAVALARWLAPAILDPRSTLAGRLRPQDIVLDHQGVPKLLSLGLPPAEAVLEVPHYSAPEALRGRPAKQASALYGLGVILFRALTGAWPVPAKNLQELLTKRPPAIRPSAYRPDLSPEVDVLVQGLLSNDPTLRVETVRDLGPWTGPSLQLDLAPAASPEAPPVRPTTTALVAQPSAVSPAERPGNNRVIAKVRDLSPSARYLVSVLSGIQESQLERAANRRQGVVVTALASPEAARALADRLAGHGVKAQVATSLRTGRGALGLLGFLTILTAGLSLVFSPIAALAFAAVGFVLAFLAFTRPPKALERGSGLRRDSRADVAALQKHVDRLAVRLVGLELPEPVARDLRDDLHRLHQRIDELARSRVELTRSLRAIDDAEAGEPLRRSVESIDTEFDAISDVLAELEATMASQGAIDPATAGDAVGRIGARLRALRAARSELGEGKTEGDLQRRRAAAQRQKTT